MNSSFNNRLEGKRYAKKLRVDIIALGIIALATLREVAAALTTTDIADICIDDTFYLHGSPTNTEYSPLYVIWLDMLEKAVGTFNALFVHQAIGFALFPFAFYSLLRLQRQSPFIAATVALLLLPSLIVRPAAPQPLVSAFAIVVGLLWMIGATLVHRWCNIWLWHTIGAFALMYARPEYLLSFALFAVIAIVTLRRSLTAPNIILAIALVAIGSVVVTQVGLPIGRGRLDVAFMQHFGINSMVFNRYGPLGNINPWTDYQIAAENSFGEATTFWSALAANPHAVAAHMAMNLVRFPIALARTLYLTNLAGFWFFSAVAGIGLGVAVVRVRSMMTGTGVPSTQPWYRRLPATLIIDRGWIISAIGYLLPFLLSMIIVYPRIHYLGIALVWMLLALFGGIQWRQSPQHSDHPFVTRLWLSLHLGLVLLFYPNPADHYAYPDGSRPYLRTIQAIQSLEVPPSQIGILGDDRLGNILQARLLAQELMPQLRVLIIPRSSTEPMDRTRFRPTSIEHPELQVFVDSDLCRPDLCSP